MAFWLPGVPVAAHPQKGLRQKADADTDSDSTDLETITPTTQGGEFETDSDTSDEETSLGPGLYHGDLKEEDLTKPPSHAQVEAEACRRCEAAAFSSVPFSKQETLFVFDWDDTLLPSTWVRKQRLRLDDKCEVTDWQCQQLGRVASLVIETLQLAKQYGTVVLVTNAERGWIELSCRKFLPSVLPILENLRMVSARTMYENRCNPSPLDWKLSAFDAEISRHFGVGGLQDKSRRKNVLSLGDGAHEREAVLRSTADARRCRAKSLKFVDHPTPGQLVQQHQLLLDCFDTVVHRDGNLDLCINCS